MKIEKTMETMSDILKSLVVKMDFVAEYMNLQLATYSTIPIDYENRSTWMYYMNMAGLKHEANSEIKMKSLDTGEFFIVTKESLKTHPITLLELKEYGSVFDYLCKDNGNQAMYIRGMINPLPMDYILNAPDLTILYHNENLVSKREDQLLKDIEVAIQNHMYQWYKPDLTFEDRYVPTMVAQLFSVMSLTIINSKLKVVNTEKASDDHIYEFLNSSNHTADIIPFLSEDTKLWIYGNIRRLMRNVGTDATLQEVVERILIPAGIDVYKLSYEEAKYEETENTNATIIPWNMDIVLMLNSMNPEDSKMEVERITEETYLKMQTEYTELEESMQVKEMELNKVVSPKNNMQSKSLVLNNKISSVSIGVDVVTMTIENWLVDSFNDKLQAVLTIHPTNDDKLTLNSRDAASLFLYLLLKESELPTSIRGFNTQTYIHRRDFSNFYQIKDSDNYNIFPRIIREVPAEIETKDVEEYKTYMRKLKLFHTMLWTLPSTCGEKIVSANASLISNFMFNSVVGDSFVPIDVSGNTQDLYAYLNSVSIPTAYINPVEIMDLILTGFTGEAFDKDGIIKSKIEIFKNFLKKFISYNIQILDLPKSTTETSVLESISIIRGMDAMLIEDIELSPLGPAINGDIIGFENKQPIRLLNGSTNIIEIANDGMDKLFPITHRDKVSVNLSSSSAIAVIKPDFFTRVHSLLPINPAVTSINNSNVTIQEYMRDIFIYMQEVNPNKVVTQESDHVASYIDSPNKEHLLTIRVSGTSNPLIIGIEDEAISLKDVVARINGTDVSIVEINENHKLFIQVVDDRVKITSVDTTMGIAKKPKMKTYGLSISDVDYIDDNFRAYMTGITMKDIVEDNSVTIDNDMEVVGSHIGPNVTIIS